MFAVAAVNVDPVMLTSVETAVLVEDGSTNNKSLVPVNVAERKMIVERWRDALERTRSPPLEQVGDANDTVDELRVPF